MEFKDIVSISGMGGLFEVITRREDGLIVRPLDEGQSKFVSSRIHVFTPLDGITIYTEKDNIELTKVLPEMKKQEKDNPPVDAKADNAAIKKYFRAILPDYDEERVYVSDIKKILKWYQILKAHDLITEEKKEEDTKELKKEEKKKEEEAPKKESSPKKEKSGEKKAAKPSTKTEEKAPEKKPAKKAGKKK